jgi:hypothetical protein
MIPRKSMPPANESSASAVSENCPKWIRLNQLPGFMWNAIRVMGESVFCPLTRTRLDRIEVIADLSGNGPHTRQEVDTTAHRLRSTSEPSNMVEYSTAEMTRLVCGLYQAQAVQFEMDEITYLLVKDPMGSYIYRWPSEDTVRRVVRIEGTLHERNCAVLQEHLLAVKF